MTEVNSQSISMQPLIHNVIMTHFRMLHLAVHTEPVRGHLRRLLRHRLFEHAISSQSGGGGHNDCGCLLPVKRCHRSTQRARQLQPMLKIVDWLAKVWDRANHFLETHHSSSVALGPRIFDTCPVDAPEVVRRWFEQLWNSSIAPYLIQAARDGLRKNELRSQFEDPCDWIERTYPWKASRRSTTNESICSVASSTEVNGSTFNLRRIQAEDVGAEADSIERSFDQADPRSSQDVLSETLNKLQRCATENH
jgi:hypothetical protein